MDEEKELVDCPSCHVKLNLPRQFSGNIACPKCEFEFTVGDGLSETGVVKIKSAQRFKFKPNADILLGLKILLIYWTIIFFLGAVTFVSIGNEEVEEDNTPNCETDECIENELRVTVIFQMIEPAVHISAFYLILGGAKDLLIEETEDDDDEDEDESDDGDDEDD